MSIMATAVLLGATLIAVLIHIGRREARADWGRAWLNVLDGLNRWFCRRYHRLKGASLALPPRGPALVVANHLSGLDPLLLLASSPRPLRFLIAQHEFDRWWLRWLFRAIGCIPVSAHTRGLLQAAQAALDAGEAVALFPQGGIVAPDRPVVLKRGVAVLAEASGAPVYPVRLSGVRWVGRTVSAVFGRSRACAVGLPPLRCLPGETDDFLAQLTCALSAPSGDDAACLEIHRAFPH